MNDTKIKVLLVEPEKYPKEIVIDDSLEAMQEVVGGDIEEYMPYDDDVAIICNEEGKMRGLPLNRAVYVQDNVDADLSGPEEERETDDRMESAAIVAEDKGAYPADREGRTR